MGKQQAARRLAIVTMFGVLACGCASHRVASEVDAVVNDETARQAAVNTATATGDSDKALKAADAAAQPELRTPPR
jgi:hypothetical protein